MKSNFQTTFFFIINLITLFLSIFSSYSAVSQISRGKVISNAIPYTTFEWVADASNIKYNSNCPTVGIINSPNWIKSGKNEAIPYCWNGFSSISSFSNGITDGKCAGNNNTRTNGDCCEKCTLGVDCSGFISRVWELRKKNSTSDLPNISTAIALSKVMPGDILITKGHVMLVDTYYSNGNIRIIEASGKDWKVSFHTYTTKELDGYSPRYYKNITK